LNVDPILIFDAYWL